MARKNVIYHDQVYMLADFEIPFVYSLSNKAPEATRIFIYFFGKYAYCDEFAIEIDILG